MKVAHICVLICAVGALSPLLGAQEVKRCDSPSGKVMYAEDCPRGTMASTMSHKGVSVTESDQYQRAAEASFQKRHAQRLRAEASERAAQRKAALAERKADQDYEKMQRELKIKEERAKRGDTKRSVRVKKKAKAKSSRLQ
jgi:hypothetical protein